jgi:uncharacterized tellurite resistance protein B-like protein
MSIGTSRLAGMPQAHREQLERNAKLLLLWMAASDGKLEETELEFVSAQFPDAVATISNEEFIKVIRTSDIAAIEKAIRAIAAESREIRTGFLDMAIAMCMADKDIAVAENHVLRFYADALHLGIGILEKRYQALIGLPLPAPGDPGSIGWWAERSANEPEPGQETSHPEAAAPQAMTIAQARAILGVSLNATQDDIEQAYRKMAAVFEIHRDEALGDADVSVANSRFRKIRHAYHLLTGSG